MADIGGILREKPGLVNIWAKIYIFKGSRMYTTNIRHFPPYIIHNVRQVLK